MSDTATVKPLKYIPAFDGVRGIFCLLIITHHWVMPYLQGPFALLWWILQLFFVLSAFLITKILLFDKTRMSTKDLFKRFYTRRSLRIFPLYFFYIFLIGGLLLLAGTTEAGANNKDVIYFKENWGFLFTYTYNFAELANYFRGVDFHPAPLFSHLWSLSLEEQFYFIFPIAIVFLPLQYLRKFILVFLFAAPFIRAITYSILESINPDHHWLGLIAFRNTLFQMDSLAYGMAIAVFDTSKIKHPVRWFLLILTAWLCYIFTSAHFLVQSGDFKTIWLAIKEYTFLTYHYNYIFLFTLTNIMCAAFVITIVNNTSVNKLFSNKPAIYLGKISYGMYVWHYFVMLLAAGLLHPVLGGHQKYMGNFVVELGMFTFYIGLLVLISHISYKYFESYFVKLKDKY